VDSDAQAIASVRRNCEKLAAADRVRVIVGSALALPPADPFDLILADPPYSMGSGTAVVRAVMEAGWLRPGGWLSVETSRGEAVDGAELALDTERDVGSARITLFRRP